jgi:hypothetical protein
MGHQGQDRMSHVAEDLEAQYREAAADADAETEALD